MQKYAHVRISSDEEVSLLPEMLSELIQLNAVHVQGGMFRVLRVTKQSAGKKFGIFV